MLLHQIARANGVMSVKGRFRNQLIGKCSAAGATFDDPKISPVRFFYRFSHSFIGLQWVLIG